MNLNYSSWEEANENYFKLYHIERIQFPQTITASTTTRIVIAKIIDRKNVKHVQSVATSDFDLRASSSIHSSDSGLFPSFLLLFCYHILILITLTVPREPYTYSCSIINTFLKYLYLVRRFLNDFAAICLG